MYSLYDLRDKVARYFPFSDEERKGLFITVAVIGFVLAFNGIAIDESNNIMLGRTLLNLINSILVAILIVLVHDTAQRISSLHSGFKPERKLWFPGIVAALILLLFSKGNLWFLCLAPAGLFVEMMPVHRLGYWRYGLNLNEYAYAAVAGPLANVALAVILSIFRIWMPGNLLLGLAVQASLAFACLNLLPIPPLDGTRVLGWSRVFYAFGLGCTVAITALLWLPAKSMAMIIVFMILALVIGFGFWLAWFTKLEGGLS